MLEVIDLAKRYGPVVALDGASFTARPGRIVGFLGPNGAGKTTTMRCIFGLARPDRGEVRWNGRAGRPRGAAALRLHARAARPVPADAGRRAAVVFRPATRPVRSRRERGGDALARPDGPGRPREVEAGGALAREPAAGPAGRGPGARPGAARAGRAVLGPRPPRDRDDDRGRQRAGAGRRRRGVQQPPARSRRGRVRGRRDHRPRADRRGRGDRRAEGALGAPPSRGRGRRIRWRLARWQRRADRPAAQRRPGEAAGPRRRRSRRAPRAGSSGRRGPDVRLPAAETVGAVHGGRDARRRPRSWRRPR